MKILAVDLGKVKSVACDCESETAEHRFETVRTDPYTAVRSVMCRPRGSRYVIPTAPGRRSRADRRYGFRAG